MKLPEARSVLGLASDMNFRERAEILSAMDSWKRLIVQARRDGKNEDEVRLNQARAVLHNSLRQWCECGRRKKQTVDRCGLCRSRNGAHRDGVEATAAIENGGVETSSDIPIPPAGHRTATYIKMCLLKKTGQSVVVEGAASGSVRYFAARLGFEVVSRKIDSTHRRVWRTDGKTVKEVNEIICSTSS